MTIGRHEEDVVRAMKKTDDEGMVFVCAACLCASCWHGEYICQRSKTAGVVGRGISFLRELGMEHEEHWSDAKLLEVFGEVLRPRYIGERL